MSSRFADRVAALHLTGADILAIHGVVAHRSGTDYAVIRCPGPGHEDRHPSCRIHLRSGRTRCFACGFRAGDLVGLHMTLGGFGRMGDALRDLERRSGLDIPALSLAASTAVRRSSGAQQDGTLVPVRKWLYRRADGTPALEIVRLQMRMADGTWRMQVAKLKPWKIYLPAHPGGRPLKIPVEFKAPGSRPLYRLPELLNADFAVTVYVVEGEPSADALGSIGWLATTSSGGSSAVEMTDWSPLAGRSVVIWPDRDAPGAKYAQAVAQHLMRLEPPAAVRLVDVDALALPEGGDAVEWVALRGGVR